MLEKIPPGVWLAPVMGGYWPVVTVPEGYERIEEERQIAREASAWVDALHREVAAGRALERRRAAIGGH